ncbi:MAG: MATE family efflux transporter [Oscillospiraceae bacterium]|nr:MATE family efflux transporter [Oscillospiraceae bacterium]
MPAHQNDLGRDPVGRLVLRLAIPAMTAQFVNVLYGIVDRIFIGHIPGVGAAALAGAGICAPLTALLGSFASLVGLGGAPLAAMRMGEGRPEGARAILSNCAAALIGLSIVLTMAVLPLAQPLLLLFGASEATLPYARSYLTVYVLGTVFALVSLGLNHFIICQGHAGAGMATVLIGAALNLLLDPLFIFTFGLGVTGAAAATVLSQAASCAFVVAFLRSRRPQVRLVFSGYSLRILKRVAVLGLSPFLIIATDSLLLLVLNAVLQRYGGPSQGDLLVTACTVVQSFLQLVTMPMAGITGGTQPILSFNYGACKTGRIRLAERYILLLCVLFTGMMFIFARLFSGAFISVFTSDAAGAALAREGIHIVTLAIVPLAFQYTFVDGLTALGIARYAVSLSLFRKSVFLASTLIFPFYWGAAAAFYAQPAADALGAVVSSAVFLFSFERLMKKRREMPPGTPLYS